MARIRTIKPEFWNSFQVTSCSTNARLLFIGLWNFCDDSGRHIADCRRIKVQIFPGDAFTTEQIREWVDELIAAKLLIEYEAVYEAQTQRFWQVTGWNHQRIDKPSSKYPPPPSVDSSNAPTDTFDDSTNGAPRTEGPEGSNTSGPDARPREAPSRAEPEDFGEICGRIPVLTEALNHRITPQPANSLKNGVWKPLQERHLKETGSLVKWHARQLGAPRPVIGNTDAHLLMVLAAGLCAAAMPLKKIRKSRVAYFINTLKGGHWLRVVEFIDQAKANLDQYRKAASHGDQKENGELLRKTEGPKVAETAT